MPVTTSKTECCLISMVERMMDSANMPDAIRMLFFLPSALCVRAKWAPMELYTWMLGHRLVGVSACHSIEIIWVKTLSLGITGGAEMVAVGP